MKHNFKLSAVSAAIMAVSIASPVFAAEAEKELSAIEVRKEQKEAVEVIEVTGFKGSLHKAMNNKKFSEGVSDSIYAEDVGKSTDQNIADALSRVTGVTVQEEGGEGTRISVRGAGADMNQISMNGVALTSNLNGEEASSSVDLGSFSADIIASIDVIKTSSADIDEGSLGATVILRTRKPLDMNKPLYLLSAEARYNDYSGKTTPRISGTYADKFFDETFGFIATVSAETINHRTDYIDDNWLDEALPLSDYNGTGRYRGQDSRKTSTTDAEGNVTTFNKNIRVKALGAEDPSDFNPETEVLVEGDENGEYWSLARNNIAVGSNTNERDRITANLGFQLRPTDDIDLQLDVTHTETKQTVNSHRFNINSAPLGDNFNGLPEHTFFDVENNEMTGTRYQGTQANLNRTTGDREQGTDVVSLRYEHTLTDDLTMELLAGYSKSTDETGDFANVGTAVWGTTGDSVMRDQPDSILEEVGYDCSDDCKFYTGTELGIEDRATGRWPYVTSRGNPLDLNQNHLSGITFINDKQSDVSKSLFANFDWALDNDFLTSIEFGAKYASRTKDVYTQRELVTDADGIEEEEDSGGFNPSEGLGSIRLVDMMSDEAFPFDNLADGLTENRDNEWFQGWPMISVLKAKQALTGTDQGSINAKTNELGTREITTATTAAYVKFNYEALDGRLTGNVGLRFVSDKTDASGYGGMNFFDKTQSFDPYDLLIERRLGDIDNATDENACPEPIPNQLNPQGWVDPKYGAANADQLTNCWDWAVTHAYNHENNGTRISTYPYIDAVRDDAGNITIPGRWVAEGDKNVNRLVDIDYSGTIPVINRNDPLSSLEGNIQDVNDPASTVGSEARYFRTFQGGGPMWQYLDPSTSVFIKGEELKETDDPNNPGKKYDVQRAYLRTGTTTDSASNATLLPSFNLNYQVAGDQVARFAVSQTMTRPNFDSLNPRATVNENPWARTAEGTMGNTQLKPLTSNNVDFSYEWYFDETGMLSAGLFYKDMKDMETRVLTPFHYQDIRDKVEFSDFNNFLMPFNEERMPGVLNSEALAEDPDCMPHRFTGNTSPASWIVECHRADIRVVQNGNGAEIKGLELGYQQDYDMLPGLLSGLGVSANYTFQTSDTDPVAVGDTGRFVAGLPQPFTPKHSANFTVFWEYQGLSMRLANRFNGVQLVDNGLNGGAVWQDATMRMDFSSSYNITKNISVNFQATNLTDEVTRRFFTASNTVDDQGNIVLHEGNVMDDSSITDSRQTYIAKSGRQFRLSLRASF